MPRVPGLDDDKDEFSGWHPEASASSAAEEAEEDHQVFRLASFEPEAPEPCEEPEPEPEPSALISIPQVARFAAMSEYLVWQALDEHPDVYVERGDSKAKRVRWGTAKTLLGLAVPESWAGLKALQAALRRISVLENKIGDLEKQDERRAGDVRDAKSAADKALTIARQAASDRATLRVATPGGAKR